MKIKLLKFPHGHGAREKEWIKEFLPMIAREIQKKKMFDTYEASLSPLGKKEALKEWPNSEYIGTIGKRDTFFIKIKEIRETQYGNIYIVSTRAGCRATFFGNPMHGVDGADKQIGDCFTVKATPKKHDINTFDGIKETRLNRVRVAVFELPEKN